VTRLVLSAREVFFDEQAPDAVVVQVKTQTRGHDGAHEEPSKHDDDGGLVFTHINVSAQKNVRHM
jgi:hypothetical protein